MAAQRFASASPSIFSALASPSVTERIGFPLTEITHPTSVFWMLGVVPCSGVLVSFASRSLITSARSAGVMLPTPACSLNSV